MRDPDVEQASRQDILALADHAWALQRDHVREHSSFYARKYAEAGADLGEVATVEELPRLPFTTKDELRASQDEASPFGTHLAVDPAEVKRVFQTSGTSGVPSVIGLAAEDIDTWTAIGARSYRTADIDERASVATTFGAGPFVAGQTHDVIRELGARSVPIGPGDTPRLVRALELGLADTILLTPTFALHLADRLRGMGRSPDALGVRRILAGGEPGAGLPGVRDSIEKAWSARVHEVMGLGDISPSLFAECRMGNGMHFGGRGFVWPELVDEGGAPVPIEAGAEGELVYTALRRRAMPLVRFRSGDHVKILTTTCACGRTSFTMRIAGRTDDMFIVRGVNVYPSAVQAVVGEFRPTFTGRIRVVLPTGAVSVQPPVAVEVEIGGVGDADLDAAISRLESVLRERLTFAATVVPIPSGEFGDAGYKTRPVVRRPI